MAQTDRIRHLWWFLLFAILALAVLAYSLVKAPNNKINQVQKQNAYSRARIRQIYATIEQLESDRGKLLAEIIKEQTNSVNSRLHTSSNINALVLQLIKEDHLVNLYVIPNTNVQGVDTFIDVWGKPYDIELLPSASTNRLPVENRVAISSKT